MACCTAWLPLFAARCAKIGVGVHDGYLTRCRASSSHTQ